MLKKRSYLLIFAWVVMLCGMFIPSMQFNIFAEGQAGPVTSSFTIAFEDGFSLETANRTPLLIGTTNAAANTQVAITLNNKEYQSIVDDKGKWSLQIPAGDALPDGNYEVNAVVLDSAGVPSNAYLQLKIDSTIQIEGLVRDVAGNIVEGQGTLRVYNSNGESLRDPSNPSSYRQYNNKGRFVIRGLSDGNYQLQAVPFSNYTTHIASGRVPITIKNGAYTGESIVLTLNTPQIRGVVKNPDGTDTSYASYQVRNIDTGYGRGSSTNNVGEFAVGNLEDGTYVIIGRPTYGDITLSNSTQQTFQIKNGVASQTFFTLNLTTPQLTGTVLDPNGNAFNRGSISIRKPDGKSIADVDLSENGQFSIGALSDGTYMVTCYPYSDSNYIKSAEQEIVISNGVSNKLVLNLEMRSPQLSATVKTPTGESAGNSFISIVDSTGRGQGMGVNGNGQVNIGGLEDGIYNLYAMPNSNSQYTRSISQTIIVQNGIATPNVLNFVLTEPQFTGTVKNPDEAGTAATGAYITVRKPNGDWVLETEVDQNGIYRIGGLEDGSYELQAFPSRGSNYTSSIVRTFTITKGIVSISDAELLLGTAQVRGTVKNPRGDENAGLGFVEVRDNTGHWVQTADVSFDGQFFIGNLENGTYSLTAYPDRESNYTRSIDYTIVVAGGIATPATIEVRLGQTQIGGTVKNPDGTNSSYGWIEVQKESGEYMPGISVNYDGNFNIGSLEDGTYELIANPDRDRSSYTKSDKVAVIVENGIATPSIINFNLKEAFIRGTVKIASSNANASYGYVEVRTPSGMWVTNVDVNREGNFNIGALEDGSYEIYAFPDDASYARSSKVEFTVSNGQPSTDVLVLNLTEPQIRGKLKDPTGNLDISYGWISIRLVDGEWIPGVGVDRAGNFSIGSLEPGDYELVAQPSNGSQYSSSKKEIVTISSDTTEPMQITMTLSNPQLSGRLLNPDGNIAANGYISLRKLMDGFWEWLPGFGIGWDGSFTVGNLEPGTYELIGNPDRDRSHFAKSAAVPIIIEQDGSATPNTLELNLRMPQLTGTVMNPDNTPAAYGHIEIRRESGEWIQSADINRNGVFAISDLSNGTYLLTAYPDNGSQYTMSQEMSITVDGGSDGQTINLTFGRPQITGVVKVPDGSRTVSHGWIEIRKANGDWLPGVGVSNGGTFNIGNLSAGTYKLIAYPNGNSEYTRSVEYPVSITSGSDNAQSIVINLCEPQIRGAVKLPGGANAAYGSIDIRKVDGEWIPGVGINRNGTFNIGNLTPGQYELTAYPNRDSGDYTKSEKETITITGTDSENINVILTFGNPQVSGKVYIPGGTMAVQYGYVQVFDAANGMWVQNADINKQGDYFLGGLNAGQYVIEAYPNYGSGYSKSQKIPFEITNGNPLTGIDIVLGATQVSGKVKDATGLDVAYGYVDIRKESGEWVEGTGVDNKGNFYIGGLEDGTYKLVVYPHFYGMHAKSAEYSLTITNGVAVGEGKLNVVLGEPQFYGVVKGPSGEKVSYGWVNVIDANGNYVAGAGVDNLGKFTLSSLEDGNYKVTVYPDWRTDFSKSSSMDLVVSNGMTETTANSPMTINLKNINIRGTVSTPGETSFSGGWVEVRGMDGGWITSTGINPDGSFKLDELIDGTYKIIAYPNNNNNLTNSQSKEFIVSDGATEVISLEFGTVNRTGSLIGISMQYLSNAWVEIGTAEGIWLATIKPDDAGNFNIPQLESGVYKIQAFYKDEENNTISSTALDMDADETLKIDLNFTTQN